MLIACNNGVNQSAPQRNELFWEKSGTLYSIRQKKVALTVAPDLGGRIVSLTCDGRQLLYTFGDMSGSTFWPSPQSCWDWPPPAVINNQPYQVEQQGEVLSILSAQDPVTGLQVRKSFSLNSSATISITYEMINTSSQAMHFAPWEITRMNVGGVSFFPAGRPVEIQSDLIPTREDSIVWYHHDGSDIKKKMFRDGSEAWIAHRAGTSVLIKSWKQDIVPADFAPGEAEIELYSAPQYLEVEVQGAYSRIEPGSSVEWNVFWQIKEIPATIDCRIGSDALIDFIRSCIDT